MNYSSSFIIAATPLTLESVTKSIEGVHWRRLCDSLYIPQSKRLSIEKQPKSEHRKLLAEWWLLTDPSPTWRSLIRGLDWFEETLAADKIRNNAEPIQGTLSMCVCVCGMSHAWGSDHLHIHDWFALLDK